MPDLEALCRRWTEAEGLKCWWRKLPSGMAVVDLGKAGAEFVYSFFGYDGPGSEWARAFDFCLRSSGCRSEAACWEALFGLILADFGFSREELAVRLDLGNRRTA